MPQTDIIDTLVGQKLAFRDRRPVTIEQAQNSYHALFNTPKDHDISLKERLVIAAFVALLYQDDQSSQFYLGRLRSQDPDAAQALSDAAQPALTQGPYGNYPKGPLSKENQPGLLWHADEKIESRLSQKLARALEHVHMLVFHPRDSSKKHIYRLLAAGWNDNSIVTLSQIVAFLSFQLRLVTGLKILAQA